jgi:hypothetical protein
VSTAVEGIVTELPPASWITGCGHHADRRAAGAYPPPAADRARHELPRAAWRQDRSVSCSLASLGTGATASLTIVVKISKGKGRRITDTATVASPVFDPSLANNTVRLTTRIH